MTSAFHVAWIDEARCIGCAKCLVVCPTDAIVGAERYLHTVITQDCIGCELCLPPCPVDCIELRPLAQKPFNEAKVRLRVKARKQRLKRQEQEREAERERRKATLKSRATTIDPSKPSSSADPLARALAAARGRKAESS